MSTSPPPEAEGSDGQPADPVAELLRQKLRAATSAAMRAGATSEEVTADLARRLERLRQRNAEGWSSPSASTRHPAVVAEVVTRILTLRSLHPVRVAISGPMATEFVEEVAGALASRADRPVVRADLREHDQDAVRAVLRSLGPGGDRRFRADSTDHSVPNDAVLLALVASAAAGEPADWDLRVTARPWSAQDDADAIVEHANVLHVAVRRSD